MKKTSNERIDRETTAFATALRNGEYKKPTCAFDDDLDCDEVDKRFMEILDKIVELDERERLVSRS